MKTDFGSGPLNHCGHSKRYFKNYKNGVAIGNFKTIETDLRRGANKADAILQELSQNGQRLSEDNLDLRDINSMMDGKEKQREHINSLRN